MRRDADTTKAKHYSPDILPSLVGANEPASGEPAGLQVREEARPPGIAGRSPGVCSHPLPASASPLFPAEQRPCALPSGPRGLPSAPRPPTSDAGGSSLPACATNPPDTPAGTFPLPGLQAGSARHCTHHPLSTENLVSCSTHFLGIRFHGFQKRRTEMGILSPDFFLGGGGRPEILRPRRALLTPGTVARGERSRALPARPPGVRRGWDALPGARGGGAL